MSSHLDWLKIGRATRGTPRRDRTPWRRWFAMALIGGMTLLQSGCQSGPLSNCRMFSPCGFLGRATNRVLHRDRGCCGSTAVSDGVVDYGAPAGVLVPAPGVIPSYPPGGVIGTSPSTVSPPALDTPSDLNEAAPKAKSVPLPGGNGTSSTTGSGARSTSYYARRDSTQMSVRSRRGPMSSPASTPVPTSRSARASSPLLQRMSRQSPTTTTCSTICRHWTCLVK